MYSTVQYSTVQYSTVPQVVMFKSFKFCLVIFENLTVTIHYFPNDVSHFVSISETQ